MDGQLKQELVDLTKAVLATFTKEYTKAYTIELVKKASKDSQKEPKPWQLEKRKDKDTSDRFTGHLTKEGVVRKSWKKRYFIVKHDYSVEYYENEAKLIKPKGVMNLAGYRVETDPNRGIMQRLKVLAEKMKIDLSAIPKPKEYPPLTIELYHSYRRIYYLTADSQKEFDDWVEIFQGCCRNAWGFKNRDKVHVAAFGVAVRNTRWSLGRWGWWGWGGSETQVLCDIIADEVEYDILGRALCGLPNVPYFIRNFMRNKLMTLIDGIISSAVSPAWIAMDKTVGEVRPQAEPKIKDQIEPIAKLQHEMLVKMKDSVMGVLEPALREHVTPHLAKIVGKEVQDPIEGGFGKALTIWDDKVSEYKGEGNDKSFAELRRYPHYYWPMEPAQKHIWGMYDFLTTLYNVFPDFWASTITYHIRGKIVTISDNACYTFEKDVKENGASLDLAASKTRTQEKLFHDANIQQRRQIHYVVRSVIKPTLMKIVNPLVKPILSTLQAVIPQSMTDFFDMDDMFNQIVDGVLADATDAAMGVEHIHVNQQQE
ncbi:pleckstrin domain-containing protein [Cavenderia fasciculata]|uniref:Pleckstrin domain-containing protein n=1 Tax=Cavenderia fasciculata TaxID=261658 RepID=F4PJ42_CACFS|nr:pleckstrin domain-containing protein [Cavenderia fasciculata]EGG24328.1 pleckstrin domain-containing protein [Cavenderia fasciculata]|eukprot:XP_004362179.1 pleckstrin domain-containing protein [Cavenderia fasciculata]